MDQIFKCKKLLKVPEKGSIFQNNIGIRKTTVSIIQNLEVRKKTDKSNYIFLKAAWRKLSSTKKNKPKTNDKLEKTFTTHIIDKGLNALIC